MPLVTSSGNVGQFQVSGAVFCDKILAILEGIAQQHVEVHSGALCIFGHDLDKPAGLRIHGGHPHHFRIIFAKTLGTLNAVRLFALQIHLKDVLLGDNLAERKNFIAENGAKYLELADIS